MRILVAHNAYQQRGGEDTVVDAEIALLRSHGHEVETYLRNNDDIRAMSSLALVHHTLWSPRTARDMAQLVGRFQPDLVHAHNTFPLISPSIYWTVARTGIPIVQTLHNFRLMCLNALFLREDKVCEDCMGRAPWRGVVHACYRGSRPASATMAGMLVLHRGLGTYRNKVTRYIALNNFCREKFIAAGLPADRISVKPNFVDFDPPQSTDREGLLFVGRLSSEKGVDVLAKAVARLVTPHLRVAGAGPEAGVLSGIPGVTLLGNLPIDSVRQEMVRAVALVVPSIWYENFPRTIVEAFASGLPVIASRIGALAEIVRDGETGLLFEPGNPHDLAEKLAWAQAHPELMRLMGERARDYFDAELSAGANYRRLMEIYEMTIVSQPMC